MPALNPEAAIRKVITDDAAIAALIGSRAYMGYAPQAAAVPFIIINRGGTEPDHYMGGASGLKMAEIDIWLTDKGDDAYQAVTDLADLVEAELNTAAHRQTVTIGAKSITFAKCFMTDQSDEPEQVPDGAGRPVRRIYQRWEIAYQN